ncbi:GTP-binding protein [Vagococcus sp. BWB3-3]|uniref:GTP-binding protein n=1 Tax=Vagococcus allomyrinae TaxID=2794353 RepID=A0A940PD54_9ENTE|nr:GTP-binding protein [Vagococcus allomyrinae]MBP1041763.1 GTP-binding protein [Vagococcus allomyrinae]
MKRLNIGILAHVDAGKTTLVERILFETNVIRQMGKIESGNTVMDSLSLEKHRGISIKNSYTTFSFEGHQINLIDTPGHYDFVDEVEYVLDVLDAVILVVSAIDGVQSQTKKFWRKLQAYGLPVIIWVNKTDFRHYDQVATYHDLTKLLSADLIQLVYKNDQLFFQEDDCYSLIEGNDELEERFLETGLSTADLRSHFSSQFNQGRKYPVIYGSAKEGHNIDQLLKTIQLVSPKKAMNELAGFVYKVAYDNKLGKGCYIRLFGGQIAVRDIIKFKMGTNEHKISQLKQLVDGKIVDVGRAVAGELVIAYGLLDGQVGDVLGNYEPLGLPKTPALFLITIEGKSGQLKELQQAVVILSEEYPALSFEWFGDSAEVQLAVMGEMQAEIIYHELTERFDLSVNVGEPKIIYRETPSQEAVGYEAYTMPKPSWAKVKLLVEAAPRGSGYEFVNKANNDTLLPRYHGQIEASLVESLKIGRLGWQVTDLKITLLEGESHREHTHPLDFALATPIALQDGLAKAEMQLLEPTVLLKITTTGEHLSKVVANIMQMEGVICREEYQGNQGYLEAVVPLATSLNYGQLFFKQTEGAGILEQEFYGYQECPISRYQYLERRGVDPLNREKWILHRRGAIS